MGEAVERAGPADGGADTVGIDIIDHQDAPKKAYPASTLVLARAASSDGGPEVLMIRRHSKTAFGGVWAFPGGRIESSDVPAGTAPDPLPAARRAAVRETEEEVGLSVDEASLRWLSHWLPPAKAPVRFSTWFFIAPIDGSAHERHGDGVVVDPGEVHEHRWFRPAEALASRARGEIELVTPTFVTLSKLCGFADVAAACAVDAPEFFATRIAHMATGARACLYEGDSGYVSGDCDAPGGRRRLVMDDTNGWAWLEGAE